MARAEEALQRAGANGRRALRAGKGALKEAETTLGRIRENHRKADDLADAHEELEAAGTGKNLDQRLADAGFGPTLKTRPTDVLERLRRRNEAAAGGQGEPKAAGR